MQKRRLGRTGLEVSVLGYGAGAVGGLFTKGAAADQERAIARAIEAGINYFDTAALYGNGESEKNLGRVLKALKADVVVGTKVRLVGRASRRCRQGDRAGHERQPHPHGPRSCRSLPAAQSAGRQGCRRQARHRHRARTRWRRRWRSCKKAGKTRFIGFSGVGETAALHQRHRFEALRHRPGRLQRPQSQRRRADAQGRAGPGLRPAARQGEGRRHGHHHHPRAGRRRALRHRAAPSAGHAGGRSDRLGAQLLRATSRAPRRSSRWCATAARRA